MHNVALLNGKFVNAGDASIGALSAAALYGCGIFTTLAIFNGEAFLLDKHLRRLRSNADAVGLDCGEDRFCEIEEHINELILKNSIVNGRARVSIFDASMSRMWSDEGEERVDTLIITADKRNVPAKLALTVSPYAVSSTSPLAGVKSCNYLENIVAVNEAKARGFDEAVRLNERGEVTSACMANLFWSKGGQLFTPSLETGCLAGTTREFVLENFDCREVEVAIDELMGADRVFISSAGIGIRQAARLDGREFVDSVHPLLNLLPNADKKRRMFAD